MLSISPVHSQIVSAARQPTHLLQCISSAAKYNGQTKYTRFYHFCNSIVIGCAAGARLGRQNQVASIEGGAAPKIPLTTVQPPYIRVSLYHIIYAGAVHS